MVWGIRWRLAPFLALLKPAVTKRELLAKLRNRRLSTRSPKFYLSSSGETPFRRAGSLSFHRDYCEALYWKEETGTPSSGFGPNLLQPPPTHCGSFIYRRFVPLQPAGFDMHHTHRH